MNYSIFDMMYPRFELKKPIRLIELFAGYGSQALALKYLGVEFEHWKICEWAVKSIQAYKDLHIEDKKDYSKDLEIGQIKEFLYNKGISSNYNEPMSKEQINRLKDSRTIYNNIKATHNLVNIQQVKGKDLEIEDTDKYDYIMTYSFPCQDLSLAGKGKGMSDTSTRSGLLWEVERILTELEERPQVLLMENVPQVHSSENIEDFNKWQLRLEELGYKNYCQDLIATDYGIPQTRNRTFMVSILGDYSYTFPKTIPLKLKLKDLLEDEVEKKYFVSDDLMDHIQKQKSEENKIYIKNATKKGYLEATDGDGIDISGRMEYHRGTVKKDKTHTLTTMGGENNAVVVEESLRKQLCNNLILNNQVKENDVIKINYTTDVITGKRDYKLNNNISPTLTTVSENEIAVTNNLRIRKLTPKECFRLMGVKDEDYEKCAKNQSEASLYHLAGDSIVVNVLMAIFKEMMNNKKRNSRNNR